ncbi:hypothetical protein [Cellulomonas denverensis]|nr:hypothetical protein [Cellulomonas denverensis]GIG24555.1 hypothetical protein Cde04nite_07990 [Cellulomonas denverensis]
MRWEKGRAEIDALIADRHLERVPASREHADRLLEQARRHLASAVATAEGDPEGAYGVLYDAGRKALWAVLANQGLRPTTRGGHIAVYQAVRAQLDPPLGSALRPFDRMRRQRNELEYPAVDTPTLSARDVLDDVPKIEAIVDLAAGVLDSMSVY